MPATQGPVYALQEAEPGTPVAVVLNRDHLNILASTDLGESWLPQARIARDKPGFFYDRISLPAVARMTDGTLVVQMDGAVHTRKSGSADWQRSKGRDFTQSRGHTQSRGQVLFFARRSRSLRAIRLTTE